VKGNPTLTVILRADGWKSDHGYIPWIGQSPIHSAVEYWVVAVDLHFLHLPESGGSLAPQFLQKEISLWTRKNGMLAEAAAMAW
jgi:hypothetical protein